VYKKIKLIPILEIPITKFFIGKYLPRS